MKKISKVVRKIGSLIEKRPLVSFFGLLGVLLALIVIGNFLRQPKPETAAKSQLAKLVEIYSIGANPRVQVTGKVDKSGVVTLIAQTAGVVQSINKTEGNQVYRGEWLFSLSTNYQGGNIPSLSRQIAEKNLNFVEDNYDTQKQMIDKRRDIANSSNAQASELRDISAKSIDETKSLITFNEQFLTSIDEQLAVVAASHVPGTYNSTLNGLNQTRSSILSGLNSLRSALRNTEYQTSGDQEPAHLADVSRDLTLQQLDIEEKSLKLNREISRLNYRIAQVSESLMYPASPVAGVVERVFVHVGDAVSPGTKLATVTGSELSTTVVALVSADMARNVNFLEKSKIIANGESVEAVPQYVSTEPTDGQLHSIVFRIPEENAQSIKNGNYVTVEIPVSKPMSVAAVPFVPLDAIYQTQTASYLFVASPEKNGKYRAESRTIELGQVVGSYVEVKKGLKEEDQVIINRDVVAGDPVFIQ
ncbi:MAG: biotin/lipoyl-binding protein [Patescibacteria group bacterium]